MEPEIVAASAGHARRLHQILVRAKGALGLRPGVGARAGRQLRLRAAFTTHVVFVHVVVFVAKVDGDVVAWAALIPPEERGIAVLDDLWVEPARIGEGVGSRLFATAREQARRLGATTLEWEAELNAIGFYERMGGSYLREQIGDWGRPLPVIGIDLVESVGNALPARRAFRQSSLCCSDVRPRLPRRAKPSVASN